MFNIQKKTPALNWHTIHRNVDRDFAEDFMRDMAEGGYDKSGLEGSFTIDENEISARHYDTCIDDSRGDLIEYRAVAA